MERTLAASGLKHSATDAAWPNEEWWRRFKNGELDRLVDKAVADNQNLQKARDTLIETEGSVQVASAKLLPSLQSDYWSRQSRNPNHGVVYSYNNGQGGREKTSAFLTPFVMTWEMDFWGKNQATMEAALGQAAAQQAEMEQTRLLLITGVCRAYLRGHALARQLQITNELITLRREFMAIAETRYQTGLETADVVQIPRGEYESSVRREATVRAALAIQKNAIARMIGAGPDATYTLFETKKSVTPQQPTLPRRLPIELLVHRPDLAAALHRAEAASAPIDNPEVGVIARQEYNNQYTTDPTEPLSNQRTNSTTVGVRFRVTLPTPGRNEPRIAEAQAEIARARADYEKARRVVAAEIQGARANLAAAQRAATLARQRLTVANEQFDLTRKSFALGEIGALDYYRVRQLQLEAQRSEAAASIAAGAAVSPRKAGRGAGSALAARVAQCAIPALWLRLQKRHDPSDGRRIEQQRRVALPRDGMRLQQGRPPRHFIERRDRQNIARLAANGEDRPFREHGERLPEILQLRLGRDAVERVVQRRIVAQLHTPRLLDEGLARIGLPLFRADAAKARRGGQAHQRDRLAQPRQRWQPADIAFYAQQSFLLDLRADVVEDRRAHEAGPRPGKAHRMHAAARRAEKNGFINSRIAQDCEDIILFDVERVVFPVLVPFGAPAAAIIHRDDAPPFRTRGFGDADEIVRRTGEAMQANQRQPVGGRVGVIEIMQAQPVAGGHETACRRGERRLGHSVSSGETS